MESKKQTLRDNHLTGKHYGQVFFDDIKCSKINNSQVYDLSFNKSRRKGECGLSNDGTHIDFPVFWYGAIVD